LPFLKERAKAGELKAFIVARYTLEQIIDMHRDVDEQRKSGSVVITVTQSE
jgi:hypothetical protein